MDEKLLEVAYYIANWNYNGLKINKEEVLEKIETKTDLKTFEGLIKDFRSTIMAKDLKSLELSENMISVHDRLKNKTVTQIRTIVGDYLNGLKN